MRMQEGRRPGAAARGVGALLLAGGLVLGLSGCFADLSDAALAGCDEFAPALASLDADGFDFGSLGDTARAELLDHIASSATDAAAAAPHAAADGDGVGGIPRDALTELAGELRADGFDPSAPALDEPLSQTDEWLQSRCELPALSQLFEPPAPEGNPLREAAEGSAHARLVQAGEQLDPDAAWLNARGTMMMFTSNDLERVRVFLTEPLGLEETRTVCEGILAVLPAQPDLVDPLVIVYTVNGDAAAASLADSCLATGDTVDLE